MSYCAASRPSPAQPTRIDFQARAPCTGREAVRCERVYSPSASLPNDHRSVSSVALGVDNGERSLAQRVRFAGVRMQAHRIMPIGSTSSGIGARALVMNFGEEAGEAHGGIYTGSEKDIPSNGEIYYADAPSFGMPSTVPIPTAARLAVVIDSRALRSERTDLALHLDADFR